MTRRCIWPFLFLVSAGGCAHDTGSHLPYDAWRLGFLAPSYMEVWIETADAVDVHDRVKRRAMSGVAAILTPPGNSGDPSGWPERPGVGAGKHVIGISLPRLIYVRWQSLAEPQTYEGVLPRFCGHFLKEAQCTNVVFMSKRRRYSPEFKHEAIALSRQPGANFRQVALEIGINPNLLSRWALEAEKVPSKAFKGSGTLRDEELAHLNLELAGVKKDRDFLRKTAVFFAKESS